MLKPETKSDSINNKMIKIFLYFFNNIYKFIFELLNKKLK